MKIVSLAPSNTEILYALGCGDEVIGVTNLCDYPSDALSKKRLGGWVNPDLKEVARLRPDIVFTSGFLQNNAVEELRSYGIEVFHVDPRSLKEVLNSFVEIGVMVGKEKQAKKLVSEFKLKLKKARKQKEKRVLCLEWLNPFMASGNWVPELLKEIGCASLLKKGEISRSFSPEELKKFNPQTIVVNVCGAGVRVQAEKILENNFFKDVHAVKKNKVFIIDDVLLNRPGPRLADGIVELSKALK